MTGSLALAPKIDTSAAPALVDQLSALRGADLVLDAAEVTMIGALGAQALMVAREAWISAGHTFALANLTDDAKAQLALLGLSEDLEPLTGDRP